MLCRGAGRLALRFFLGKILPKRVSPRRCSKHDLRRLRYPAVRRSGFSLWVNDVGVTLAASGKCITLPKGVFNHLVDWWHKEQGLLKVAKGEVPDGAGMAVEDDESAFDE